MHEACGMLRETSARAVRDASVMAGTGISKCARPRAQRCRGTRARPGNLMRSYIWTLLRPRTGALRQRLMPPSLREYSGSQLAIANLQLVAVNPTPLVAGPAQLPAGRWP